MAIRLLNASGCLDPLSAPDVARSLDVVVTKTITPLPRAGNPPVRIAETEHGMLNSIGLQGPGIDAFVDHHLPRLAGLGVPLWVSVGGFSTEDYALCCARLDGDDRVDAIELNLSCPNVEEAPETAAELVAAARGATSKALYAKLSPAQWDVAESARAVVAAGADGLSLVNTIRGLALDPGTLRPRLARAVGGDRARAASSRARLRPRVCGCGRRADRGDGRRLFRARRPRARRGGSERRRARDGALRRPARARAYPGRAGDGGRGSRLGGRPGGEDVSVVSIEKILQKDENSTS